MDEQAAPEGPSSAIAPDLDARLEQIERRLLDLEDRLTAPTVEQIEPVRRETEESPAAVEAVRGHWRRGR